MDTILQFDYSVIFWIQAHMVNPFLTPFMYGISKISSSGAIWIILGLILLGMKKYRLIGLTIMISLFLVLIVGDLSLKHLVGRLRPFVDFPNVRLVATPPAATSYSFPSGHAFSSFAAAIAIYIGFSHIDTRKRILGVIAIIIATMIAFSRVYLFVHYPTDVLAGAALGIIDGIVSWYIGNYVYNYV
ncbi:phosphatase PAP2 family protein [Veillonella sp. YH-vei2232]|jgi:undecaprenyl-diphosphatase|uniref:Phosphatase PAP2 family protein n=1 Tax=Veillonella absiana TaxID=3079305 RepID=A0ABU3ZAI9_9FIRM|nr:MULTISPECIES: phosphatase PAP2 family protein [unclassified Veillonella]NCB95768.1 phosphatase PAP2 family protein [Negativicutes bacterium]MBK7921273.1 phosphatase PAP2 family protein [Veillonella sp.]MBP6923889.1 phosphatase PAP2 family protein [Veillonella sp.]MBP8616669.1 phosphatase PAP2 family protein [Veillonella sp.]MBP9550354.1 phosphatase PAP2 family protein [Veillonella sp.]